MNLRLAPSCSAFTNSKEQAGAVGNILRIHSLAPHVLAAHLELYKAAMHSPGEISRQDREMIAVVVSQANNCHY